MSTTLQGPAPIVFAQTIAGGAPGATGPTANPFTDTDAVNTLLNYTNTRNFSNFTSINMMANASNLMLQQATNRSLLVAYNSQTSTLTTDVTGLSILSSNIQTIDTLGFNKTASTVLTTESFQLQSISPNGGLISNSDNSNPLTLTEVPSGQSDQNGLNNVRILNMTGILGSNFSINYSGANVTNAFGKEGVAYFYNNSAGFAPNYKAIPGYENLATNHIALNVSTLNTLNATYNYELIKLSYGNPTFAISSSGAGAAGIVDAFGTANLTAVNSASSYSYLAFLNPTGYNYSGLMGNAYNSVVTSELDVNLSNNMNVTQAFTYASGNNALNVSSTFVSINNVTLLSVAQNLSIADTLNVTVSPSTVSLNVTGSPAEPQYNGTNSILIVQQAENLPSGHAVDPMSLTFDSSNRSIQSGGSGSYGVTAAVYYPIDNVMGRTVLPDNALTTSSPVYNVTMLAPTTVTTAIPNYSNGTYAGNVSSNLNGMYGIYDYKDESPYTDGFTVTASSTTNVNVVGRLQAGSAMNFQNFTDSSYMTTYLAKLTNAGADYNSSNGTWGYVNPTQYIVLDNVTSNGQQGFGVLGGSCNSMFEMDIAPTGDMRLLLVPTDPKNTALLTATNVNNVAIMNMTASTAQLYFGSSDVASYNNTNVGSLEYKVGYGTNGPVSYADFPSGTYRQSYTLVFPSVGELAQGNLRPQQVVVDGWDNQNNRLNNTNAMVIGLGRPNIPDLCLNSCNTTIAGFSSVVVSCSVIVDVSLSGLKAYTAGASTMTNSGSMYLRIPLTYTINNNNGVYSYSGGVPTATINVVFQSNQLYTHQLFFEGLTTKYVHNGVIVDNGPNSWKNFSDFAAAATYNTTANSSWYVDLRESYDILTFNTQTSLYTLNFALYPQVSNTSPSFTNVPFVIPIASSSTGWTAQVWDISNSTNLQSLNGLDIVSMENLSNYSNQYTTPTVTVMSSGTAVTLSINANGVVASFYLGNPSGSVPIFFAYTSKALVDTNDNLGSSDHHILMSNNTDTQIASGVYITSSNVANGGHAVGNNVVTVTLNKDRYSGIAYTNQTSQSRQPYNTIGPIPDLSGGVSVLIGTSLPNSGVTTGLNSSIVRGYPSSTYNFLRSQMSVSAAMGSYNESFNITPPSQSTPTNITLNMGHNFGIKLQLTATLMNSAVTVFTVNKTNVNVVYKGVTYSYTGGTSMQILNLIQSVGQSVPWVELLYLNNFFIPGTNSLQINYNQQPVLIQTAQYNCVNNTDAQTAVNQASYSAGSAYTDAQIAAGSYVLRQDQASFTFDQNNSLRNQAKNFYVTVAPLDVAISHLSASSVGQPTTTVTRYISLSANSSSYVVAVDQLNAPYTLNVGFNMKAFQQGGVWPSSNFQYNHNLYSLRGSADGVTYDHDYFDLVDFTNPATYPSSNFTLTVLNSGVYNGFYDVAFFQNGFSQNSGDIVHLTFSSAVIRPVYGNGWSNPVRVSPATTSYLSQYELTFRLNATTKLLQPVITKYNSVSYPSEYLGATGTLNTANGYYNNLQCLSAYSLTTPVSVAGLPYMFNNATYFPATSTGNVTSTSWSPISPIPGYIDLIYQVRNGATGSAFYNNLMAVTSGDFNSAKLVSVFAKDILVVEDYANNLLLRVGPDGHFYAGDVSTYSVSLTDNQSPAPVNGLFVPVFNSDVNLNAGVAPIGY
jgi:hypothetical protein